MHMADALLSPAVAATMYAATAGATGVSIHKLRKEEDFSRLPAMAVSAALVFAGQMINYTIPGTGSSGHICGGMLLSALLGPQAGFLSMVVILAIQCLFFADGGLMALGANCWNMAFYGCFVGYYLIWRPILRARKNGEQLSKSSSRSTAGVSAAPAQMRLRIALASVLGCTLTLQMGAFSVVLETSLSGITELPFGAFMALMQPIHLAIGLVEGLVTSAILIFVYESRPEMVQCALRPSPKRSVKSVIVILAVIAVLTAGGLSLLASSNPDGLEWSLFGNSDAGYGSNMGLNEEAYGTSSPAADTAARIQEKTAILPDYNFTDGGSNSVAGAADSEMAGTSVSGLVGIVMVAALAAAVCLAGRLSRKKHVHSKKE